MSLIIQVLQSLVVLVLAPALRGRDHPGGGSGHVQARPERAAALPGPGETAAQRQRHQRSGVLGVPRCSLRGVRLLPDRVGDRPIITSTPLPLAFLADLIGGAFVLALASFAISLAALDTASPFGGLGASRASWIGSMAEPALILVFFTVGAVSASDNPYLMNHAIAGSPYVLVLPTHLLGLLAFFMIVLVENGRIPIDNPGGSTEISMIEEGRVLEYSGRQYALVKWGSWMKLFLMSAIFMNVFVLPWGLGTSSDLPGALLAIPVLLGKLALCGLAIVVIDTSFAKLRFFRIAEFLGASFLLALVGVATSYVIGA